MKILIFGGASSKNKSYIKKLKSELFSNDDVILHEYDCWNNEAKHDDNIKQLQFEINLAKNKYANYQPDLIVAKSLGCLFAESLYSQLGVKQVLLLGFPTTLKKLRNAYSSNFEDFDGKINFVINSDDKISIADDLDSIFVDLSDKLIIDNDTHGHTYDNFKLYEKLIE